MSSKAKYQKTSKPGVYTYKGKKGLCYYYTYRLDGKLKWKRVGWDYDKVTVTKAHKERMKMLSDIQFGKRPNVSNNLKMDDAFKQYMIYLATNEKDSATFASLYKNYVDPYLGNLKLKAIDSNAIESTKAHWTNLATGSKGQILTIIRAMFNLMIKQKKYYGPNPVNDVEKPSVKKDRRLRFLTQQEVKDLLDALKDKCSETYLQTLISVLTGLRLRNVVNLHKMDLDFDSNIIVARDAKGGVDYTVTMPKVIRDLLKDYEYHPNGRLFSTYRHWVYNKVVDDLGLNDSLPLVKKNGEMVPDKRYKVVFHTLRHTFATWLAKNGENLLSIQNKMGHKTIEMTMRYAKHIPGNEQEVLDKLADTFLG